MRKRERERERERSGKFIVRVLSCTTCHAPYHLRACTLGPPPYVVASDPIGTGTGCSSCCAGVDTGAAFMPSADGFTSAAGVGAVVLAASGVGAVVLAASGVGVASFLKSEFDLSLMFAPTLVKKDAVASFALFALSTTIHIPHTHTHLISIALAHDSESECTHRTRSIDTPKRRRGPASPQSCTYTHTMSTHRLHGTDTRT